MRMGRIVWETLIEMISERAMFVSVAEQICKHTNHFALNEMVAMARTFNEED